MHSVRLVSSEYNNVDKLTKSALLFSVFMSIILYLFTIVTLMFIFKIHLALIERYYFKVFLQIWISSTFELYIYYSIRFSSHVKKWKLTNLDKYVNVFSLYSTPDGMQFPCDKLVIAVAARAIWDLFFSFFYCTRIYIHMTNILFHFRHNLLWNAPTSNKIK